MTIRRSNATGPVEMLLAGEDPEYTPDNYGLVLEGYFFTPRPLLVPGVEERTLRWLDRAKELGLHE
jgi:hypothetical protein